MEKTEFGMEQGDRKTTKLEIRYNLVKTDGSFGDHINVNSDNEDCWFVNYDEFTMIVDSATRIIELGSIDIDPDELSHDWVEMSEFDVELWNHKHFLDKLVMFIEKIDANRWAEDYQPQDPTIKTFDLLWSHGYISEDPIAVGKVMEVDPAYLDSFIQWYVELGDLEYTPWINHQNDFVEVEVEVEPEPKDLSDGTAKADINYHIDFLDNRGLNKLCQYAEKLAKGEI